MISWCAYCQTFQGEFAPFQDYSISHGVCGTCARTGLKNLGKLVPAARELATLYNRMRTVATAGEEISIKEIMAARTRLGLRSLDICIGLVQPMLSETAIFGKCVEQLPLRNAGLPL